MRVGEALSPLRERRFRLLWSAQAMSVLGDNISPIALAFAVIGLDGSAVELGLVLAARSIPMVALVVPAGVIADRFGRSRVMIASDLVSLASQGGLAALLIAGEAHLWQVVAFQAVYGAAAALFLPAASGLVPETVSPERLQRANALLSLTVSGALVAGPVLAGLLVAGVGPGWAIAADAATFAVSASLLSRLGTVAVRGAEPPAFLADLVTGWREVRSRTWIWASILDFCLFQLVVYGSFFVLGPIVAVASLGGAKGWAAVVTAYGIGAVAGSVLALRWRPSRPLVAAFLGSLLAVPALGLLAIPAALVLVAAGWAAAGVAIVFGNVLWETTLQERIGDEIRSRVSAYDWLGSLAMRPLGYVAVGPLATLLGVETTLWVAAGTLLAVTAATLALPAIRQLERDVRPADPGAVRAS